jgi:hypothetical protein
VAVLLAAVGIAVVVTYARIPVADLYHVSVGGLRGGFGRALVYVNFPVALLAVPLALVAADVLRPSRVALPVALVAVCLCLVTAWPGVVDQDDLDAKPVNALPAVGVGLTALLVALAWPRLPRRGGRLAGDPLRLVLSALLAVAAIPWIFAELGFFAPDPIQASEPSPDEPLRAVHLGHHHGMDGVLIALGALALSRLLPLVAGRLVRALSSFLLALLLVYGLANMANDDWHEQVVKRGWTDERMPSVLLPKPSPAWGVLVLAAVAVYVLWFRREQRSDQIRTAAAPEPLATGSPRSASGPEPPT